MLRAKLAPDSPLVRHCATKRAIRAPVRVPAIGSSSWAENRLNGTGGSRRDSSNAYSISIRTARFPF